MSYEHDEEEDEGPQVEAAVADLMEAPVPDSLKGLRACKRCGLLQTFHQFEQNGCPNCPYLDMSEEGTSQVRRCTTGFFEGTVAVMDPRDSWAARWIRVQDLLPGVYAITVVGAFDRELEEKLENLGVQWRCRMPTTNQS